MFGNCVCVTSFAGETQSSPLQQDCNELLLSSVGTSTKSSESPCSEYAGSGRNYDKQKIRGTVNVMTEKVVVALDSCQISYRKSVHIIGCIGEALGYDTNQLILNKTSFNQHRKKYVKTVQKTLK